MIAFSTLGKLLGGIKVIGYYVDTPLELLCCHNSLSSLGSLETPYLCLDLGSSPAKEPIQG